MSIRSIGSIRIGDRHRKDMGDLVALGASIKDVGLLHPIVVKPDGCLIAGERRLAACRQLGWKDVQVTVVTTLGEAVAALKAERDENTCRLDFSPLEAVAIGAEIEAIEKPAAKERQRDGGAAGGKASGKLPEPSKGETRDKVAAAVGMSGRTYEKAKAVAEAAKDKPEIAGKIADEMHRTRNVDGAYRKLKDAERQEKVEEAAASVPAISDRYELRHAECVDALSLDAESVDLIITDPPYPAEFVPLFDGLGQVAAHVLKPGGVALVMIGQTHLPNIIAQLGRHLTYHWTIAYLTPGGQAVQQFPRRVNAFWKPVLVYRKGEYTGDWFGDVARSDTNDNDKEHHHWGQSASGMRDLMKRFVRPGNVVLDPFLGGGTTAVVALELGANFIGFDIDESAITTTKARIGEIHAAMVA